jgi:8-oxo-dGTP diphosphatase
MIRAQCIVHRENKLLLLLHFANGKAFWALPGGAVEDGEIPPHAALRELEEECCVTGKIIRETSRWVDPPHELHTYLVEIGDQTPKLGYDPEVAQGKQELALMDLKWLRLSEIPERDRAFIWSAGLLSVTDFAEEVLNWGDDLSYPEHED